MKILTIALLLILPFNVFSQHNIGGRYFDHFGSSIDMRADSTFKFEWKFDSQKSWTKGVWTVNNDTIYFKIILVYDTLKKLSKNATLSDSLVLVRDENLAKKTPMEIILANPISQNRIPPPEKLFYRHSKLYQIKNDQLVKTKIKGMWTEKKYTTFFIKHNKQ